MMGIQPGAGEGLLYLALFIIVGIAVTWITAYIATKGVLAAIRKEKEIRTKDAEKVRKSRR